MEYALIKNNKVVNTIIAEPEFLSVISGDYDHIEPLDTQLEQNLGVSAGWGWFNNSFVPPEAPPEPEPLPPPVWQWYIDIGPFYDRFGASKMAVLTSNDTGVKAILADLNIRKWVDLQRPDVAQALAYVGSVISSVDSTLQSNILNTPVQEIENLALRKLYFS